MFLCLEVLAVAGGCWRLREVLAVAGGCVELSVKELQQICKIA